MLFSAIFGTFSFSVTPAGTDFGGGGIFQEVICPGPGHLPPSSCCYSSPSIIRTTVPGRASVAVSGSGWGHSPPPPQIVARPSKFSLAVLLTHCGQLKVSKFDAARCQILRLKCTKFDFSWSSAQIPLGELTALLRSPSWI